MAGTVFFDVDTQIDFVFPAGALYVPGAARLVPVIAGLNALAAATGILVVSTVDAHPENDGEFTEHAAHCIRGTAAQRKPESTLLPARLTLPENTSIIPCLDGIGQVLIEQTSVDCFRNRNLVRLLTGLGVTRCVVYGVAAEIAVHHAAMGLLRFGCEVHLVTDAIAEINGTIARRARADFVRDGGHLLGSTAVATRLTEPPARDPGTPSLLLESTLPLPPKTAKLP